MGNSFHCCTILPLKPYYLYFGNKGWAIRVFVDTSTGIGTLFSRILMGAKLVELLR